MYKKIRLNIKEELMEKVTEKSEVPLSLTIKLLLEEYIRNKNLRKKINGNS